MNPELLDIHNRCFVPRVHFFCSGARLVHGRDLWFKRMHMGVEVSLVVLSRTALDRDEHKRRA